MVVVGCCLLFQNQVAKGLNALSLLPQQERITELYFVNAESIPKNYNPNTDFQIRFRITNRSDQGRTYTYIIAQSSNGLDTTDLYKGQVTLAPSESKTLDQTIRLKDTGQKTQINVGLENMPQRINAWLTKR
jgi:hypothetical protein